VGRGTRVSVAIAGLAILATLVGSATFATQPAQGASTATRMVKLINKERAKRGLAKLHSSRSLRRSATGYARSMFRRGVFSHASRIHASHRFRTRGEALEWHRGWRSGLHRAVRSWLRSPAHRALLLSSRFRYVGPGRARGHFQGGRATFWVLHFGAK
jgi:uncharacterized protein YkwD